MEQTFSCNVFAPFKDIFCLGKQSSDMYESVNTTLPNTLACTRTGSSCVWKVTCVLHLFPQDILSTVCFSKRGGDQGK